MVILAIDFGLKHLGLAIYKGYLVEPFGQIKIKDRQRKLLVEKLINICLVNKVNLIVIGLPEGRLVSPVKRLAVLLQNKLTIKVVLQDESFTSKEAVLKMVEAGKPKMKRRKDQHQIAACLILQSYIAETGLDHKEKY